MSRWKCGRCGEWMDQQRVIEHMLAAGGGPDAQGQPDGAATTRPDEPARQPSPAERVPTVEELFHEAWKQRDGMKGLAECLHAALARVAELEVDAERDRSDIAALRAREGVGISVEIERLRAGLRETLEQLERRWGFADAPYDPDALALIASLHRILGDPS